MEFLLLVGMPIVENEQKIREFLSFLKQFKKQTNQLLHLPNSGNTCIDFWGQKSASCSYERYQKLRLFLWSQLLFLAYYSTGNFGLFADINSWNCEKVI